MKKALFLSLFFLLLNQSTPAQTVRTDSLYTELKHAPTDTHRVNILNQLAYRLVNAEPEQSKILAEEALQLAKEKHFSRGEAESLYNIGYYYKVKGNYSLTTIYILKGIKIFESLGDKQGIADCYNLIGIVSFNKGYSIEITYFNKALKLYESIKDWKNVAKTYANIGDTYMVQEDYTKALAYLFKGLAISQKIHNQEMLGFCYANIGEVYEKQGKYEEATEYAKKGLEISIILNNKMLSAYGYACLGKILYKQDKLKEALVQYHQSLDTAQKFGFLEEIKVSTQGLSLTYARLNEYKQAYYYQSRYLAAKDTLSNDKSTREMNGLQSIYELDKKQAEIALLQKDREIKAKETERQKLLIYFLLACFALVLAVIFLLLRNIRQTKQTNRLLNQQKKEIESQKGAIDIHNNILEQKNKELVIEKDRAEAASRAKADFLSTMSHEIRTPMNAVIGITHLLLQGKPQPEQVEHLNILKFSAENLLSLINDILDFSKIEAGKVELEAIEFNLPELINSVRYAHVFQAADKGIAFKSFQNNNLPEVLVGDPTRIGQILTNLISNAIKFTQEGYVSIQASVREANNGFATVHFVISDTGVGIAADKIHTIFESFTQASSNTTRMFGGSGLGLAITKKLLVLMNSQIVVKSELGQGTEFCFDLVLSIRDKPTAVCPVIVSTQETLKLKGVKFLIVDDNEINRLIVSTFLKKWDAHIDTAENGLEALAMVKQKDYDIVLMDLQMPVMDGYETTKEIRKLEGESYQKLPIFALTADAMLDIKDRAFAAGMDDYVSKPFNPSELYQKLVKYMHPPSKELEK